MGADQSWKMLASTTKYDFPDLANVESALGDLITLGADLEPETLIDAYSQGYFPMYVDIDNTTVLGWFSPQQRAIFEVESIRITKSLKKNMKKFEYRINSNFKEVMRNCMELPRDGGWINEDFVSAYCRLHELHFAHSVETYLNGKLVGGLYGVGFGGFFAGESMFSIATDASKAALVYLKNFLQEQGGVLLDAQWLTPHLQSLGATAVSREKYLEMLHKSLQIGSIAWP